MKKICAKIIFVDTRGYFEISVFNCIYSCMNQQLSECLPK